MIIDLYGRPVNFEFKDEAESQTNTFDYDQDGNPLLRLHPSLIYQPTFRPRLAHELGHIGEKSDIPLNWKNLLSGQWLKSELRADKRGIRFLSQAGYNPMEMTHFIIECILDRIKFPKRFNWYGHMFGFFVHLPRLIFATTYACYLKSQ